MTKKRTGKSVKPGTASNPEKPVKPKGTWGGRRNPPGGRKEGQKMGAYFKPWFRRIVARRLTDNTAWLWFMKMTPKERMHYLLNVDPTKVEHSGDLFDPIRKAMEEMDEKTLERIMATGQFGQKETKKVTRKK